MTSTSPGPGVDRVRVEMAAIPHWSAPPGTAAAQSLLAGGGVGVFPRTVYWDMGNAKPVSLVCVYNRWPERFPQCL